MVLKHKDSVNGAYCGVIGTEEVSLAAGDCEGVPPRQLTTYPIPLGGCCSGKISSAKCPDNTGSEPELLVTTTLVVETDQLCRVSHTAYNITRLAVTDQLGRVSRPAFRATFVRNGLVESRFAIGYCPL